MAGKNYLLSDIKAILNRYDSNLQAEIAAQLFLEYCVYKDHCETAKSLAPLINTVAEALTKNLKNEDGLQQAIRAVQLYLQTPPVEYFGDTLVRLDFLDKESVDEMLPIKPADKVFGTFLMEHGLITQEQRDIAVIAQKRLFTVHEIYTRVVNPKQKKEDRKLNGYENGEIEDRIKQNDVDDLLSSLGL